MDRRHLAIRADKALTRIQDGIQRLGGDDLTLRQRNKRPELEHMFTLENIAGAIDDILVKVGLEPTSDVRAPGEQAHASAITGKAPAKKAPAKKAPAKPKALPPPVATEDTPPAPAPTDTTEGHDGSSDGSGDAPEKSGGDS